MSRRKQKITYTFYNPNSEEVTLRVLTDVLAEVMVTKVKEMVKERAKREKEAM